MNFFERHLLEELKAIRKALETIAKAIKEMSGEDEEDED